jgi:hypothetical protein
MSAILDGPEPPQDESPPLESYVDTITPAKANGARHAPLNQAASRFPRVWLDNAEFALKNDDYVKHLIGRKANVLIYGPSGDGKTFFTLDLLAHIASGQQWRNRKTRQCLVIYVAAEAGTSILRRFVAWRDKFLSDSHEGHTPMAIITRGANLLIPGDLLQLMDEFRAIGAQAQLPIGIVAFDTLSRSMPGGDENSSMAITQITAAADSIRDELDATTIFIHHTGKATEKGARGHSSLFAAADTAISVIDKTATVEKSRDGMTEDRFSFHLDIVTLGEDEDGEAITTCLVQPTTMAEKTRPKFPVSGVGLVAIQALQEAIANFGEILPETSSIPNGIKAVTLKVWREQFILRYGAERDIDDAAVRQAFKRGKEALLKSVTIGISTPYVWIYK